MKLLKKSVKTAELTYGDGQAVLELVDIGNYQKYLTILFGVYF